MNKDGGSAGCSGFNISGRAGSSGAGSSGFTAGSSNNKTCDKLKKSNQVKPLDFQEFRVELISKIFLKDHFKRR